jgi:serine/threonine protein kinase/GNAT superfamily N-acetyltransferase
MTVNEDIVVFRPAAADDETFVNDLLRTTMQEYVEATWPDDLAAHQHYYELNKFDPSNTRILRVGGKDVGRLSTTVRADCMFIDELHIRPEYQRRGIGEQAVEHVIKEAQEKRLPVKLTVLAVNPAQNLYLRMGFKVVAEKEHRLHMQYTSDRQFGRYEIVRPLWKGKMAEVYLARDPLLDRHVVIKALLSDCDNVPEAKERFKREAWALSQLNDPGICTIYDRGEDFLVLEYVDGDRLHGPLEYPEAVTLAIKITEALKAVHAKNIVHRDLKPDNILVTSSGGTKLIDFGHCVVQNQVAEPNEPTVSYVTPLGTLLGTLPYMSPEQAETLPVDVRSDVFSFGSVFYEMLSGTPPFPLLGKKIRDSIIHDDPVPLSVPPDLQGILRRCHEKNRERRFQTASDLNKALHSACPAVEPMQIKVCDDWHDDEVKRLMSSAQSSIDIVDSYYDEANDLANYVKNALRWTQRLQVNLYMLDPTKPFGGQRLIEILDREAREQNKLGALDKAYKKWFEHCCRDVRAKFSETERIKESGTVLKLYCYSTMPCLRMFVVDRSHFVVGWFPLNETNPNYPCIIVSKLSPSEADRGFVERLSRQLDKISESAVEV